MSTQEAAALYTKMILDHMEIRPGQVRIVEAEALEELIKGAFEQGADYAKPDAE